jgi:hypothetical protein
MVSSSAIMSTAMIASRTHTLVISTPMSYRSDAHPQPIVASEDRE